MNNNTIYANKRKKGKEKLITRLYDITISHNAEEPDYFRLDEIPLRYIKNIIKCDANGAETNIILQEQIGGEPTTGKFVVNYDMGTIYVNDADDVKKIKVSYLGTGSVLLASDVDKVMGGVDYNQISNKPQINNVEINGNQNSEYYGLQSKISFTQSDANKILSNDGTVLNWKSIDDEVSSAISNKADKATSLSGYGIADAYTKTEIDGRIASVYKPAGSVTFASLPTLSSNVLGYVYNVTDAFTTTANFVEGAGKNYSAGTNVVVVDTGTSTNPIYKFDVLSGFVDLSGYVPTSRTINNKALTGNISLTAYDVGAISEHQDIKILNTNNTTPQDVISNEAITGYGVIGLHKVSKTGSYNDLLDKPANRNTYAVNQEILIGEWTENGVTYDLYRKVVNVGALPNNTMVHYSHGITNKHSFTYMYGFAKGPSNYLTIPNAAPNSANCIYLAVGNNYITITTGTDRSAYTGYIVLEFTRIRI